MKQNLLVVFSVLAIASTVHGQLIVNGDFSAPSAGAGNHVEFGGADAGWFARGFNVTGGEAVNILGIPNTERQIGQLTSIGAQTGNQYNLTFDWTSPGTATVADSLNITYSVVAFVAGTSPLAGDQILRFINSTVQTTSTDPIGTGGSFIDLTDGSTHAGRTNADVGTFGAAFAAGTTNSASIALNFGGTNIEDYDYIGIRFFTGNAATEAIGGGVLDNVAVTAVPEPSAVMLVFMALSTLFLLKKRK